MDISDINKVVNRKKMSEDSEKLREKVSHETAKIIKLKVAQDTMYWDLKEKLKQVEANHERLQQNMVEVQMQYETISSQYQEELRIKPETLNKLSSTRQLCDVLEEYSGRLKATVSRCKADQAAMCQTYANSAQRVQDMRVEFIRTHELQLRLISHLEEKLKLTTEHESQMVQYLHTAQQQSEAAAEESRAGYVQSLSDLANLTSQLERRDTELMQKNETIVTLQNDMKRLVEEFDSHSANAKQIIDTQEKELSAYSEAKESLEKALRTQENMVTEECENNRRLTEQLVAANEARDHALETNALLLQQLQEAQDTINRLNISVSDLNDCKHEMENIIKEKEQEAQATVDHLNISISELTDCKHELENVLNEKKQIIQDNETDYKNLAARLTSIELEKLEVTSELHTVEIERDHNANTIQEMLAAAKALENKIRDMETDYNKYRECSEEMRVNLERAMSSKEGELKAASDTIARLMGDVQAEADARHVAEAAREQLRRETDAAATAHAHEQSQLTANIAQLECAVKKKESELDDQMKIILEMRGEKERLREKIQSMQNTIDNIQKELVGRGASAVKQDCEKPQRDDTSLFNLFSDSSVDGDGLDQAEVNRRFEALSRGERPPSLPLPLRRSAATARRKRSLSPKDNDSLLSLSQVRNGMFFKNKKNDAKSKKTK